MARVRRDWFVRPAVLVALLIVAATAGCRVQPVRNPPGPGPNPDPPAPDPPKPLPPVFCELCGVAVPQGTPLKLRPLMVLLDNHPAGRPQSGVPGACLVFETLAEGGITRLAPVFAHAAPEHIGPVRSVRHYFLDLALGLDAFLAHSGQSPQAAVDIKKLNVADLNEFDLAEYYWRESARKSPHNLFTSAGLLRAAAAKGRMRLDRGPASVWPYDVGAAPAAALPEAHSIRVEWPFSANGHVTVFRWRAPAEGREYGLYERSVNGKLQLDAVSAEPLGGRTVVVLFAKMWRIAGDSEGRLDAQLTGQGKATVVSDGRLVQATWRKTSRTSPLELVGADKKRLILPPGQTWVLIVPEQTVVEVLGR